MRWQQLRNRVAVALQLGAGLAPGDVRALDVQASALPGGRGRARPWTLRVPGNGNMPARETPVAPWAGALLQHWLQVRAQAAIAGPWLFPATCGGKPWGKESQYTAARQVLADAQLGDPEGGSYRLRHTFALRQLRRRTNSDQVALWLGIEPMAMAKYRRIVAGFAEVV